MPADPNTLLFLIYFMNASILEKSVASLMVFIFSSQIALSAEKADLTNESIVRLDQTLAGGFFQYGIMLIEQNAEKDKVKNPGASPEASSQFGLFRRSKLRGM